MASTISNGLHLVLRSALSSRGAGGQRGNCTPERDVMRSIFRVVGRRSSRSIHLLFVPLPAAACMNRSAIKFPPSANGPSF